MTRYALDRHEPLLVELETFCDFVRVTACFEVVTLDEGLETVRYAEAVLRSSAPGETIAVEEPQRRGGRRRTRQDRPANRRADRAHGHDVIGCDVDPRGRRVRQRRARPVPRRGRARRGARAVIADGRLKPRATRAAAVAEGADLVIAVPPLVVDDHARPDCRDPRCRHRDIAAGLQDRVRPSGRDDVACPHDARPRGARAGDRQRPAAPSRTSTSCSQSRARLLRADLPDLRPIRSSSAACRRPARRAVELYESFIDAPVWSLGSAEAAELTKLAETTYRDLNIAYANELA